MRAKKSVDHVAKTEKLTETIASAFDETMVGEWAPLDDFQKLGYELEQLTGDEPKFPSELLRDSLKHEHPRIRLRAAIACGRFSTRANGLVSELQTALDDTSVWVSLEAAYAMWSITGNADPSAIVCARFLQESIPILQQSISSDSVEHYRALYTAEKCLKEMGKQASIASRELVAAFERAIERGQYIDAKWIAEFLYPLKESLVEYAPRFVHILKNKKLGELHIVAAEVLAAIGPSAFSAIPVLNKCIRSRNDELAVTAAFSLCRITEHPAIPLSILMRYLSQYEGRSQKTVSNATPIAHKAKLYLKQMAEDHQQMVVSALEKELRGNSWQNYLAAVTLSEIDPTNESAIRRLAELLPRFRSKASFTLNKAIENGGPAEVVVPILTRQLTDLKNDPSELISVLLRCGEHAYSAVPQLLVLSTDDKRPAVVSAACRALWRIAGVFCPNAVLRLHGDDQEDFSAASFWREIIRADFPIKELTLLFNSVNVDALPKKTAPSPDEVGQPSNVLPKGDQSAETLEAELAEVQAPIVEKLNQWLAGLEGTKFERGEAEQRIAEIKRVVARAGRELVYQGKPVTLYCNTAGRRKNALIRVTTVRRKPQQELSQSTSLPRLTTRKIP